MQEKVFLKPNAPSSRNGNCWHLREHKIYTSPCYSRLYTIFSLYIWSVYTLSLSIPSTSTITLDCKSEYTLFYNHCWLCILGPSWVTTFSSATTLHQQSLEILWILISYSCFCRARDHPVKWNGFSRHFTFKPYVNVCFTDHVILKHL